MNKWRTAAGAALIFVAGSAAFGQCEFEVASVKPARPSPDGYTVSANTDPALVRFTNMSMENFILMAYRLKPFQISGPDWLQGELYDLTAKRPDGACKDQFPAMMQKMLEQRFAMKVHHENKVLPVYALVVSSGGLKIHPSPPEEAKGGTRWTPGRLEAHQESLSSLALSISGAMDRPVVDETGVKDVFDFTLDFASDQAHEDAGVPSMRTALEETLGLKLEPRKEPVEILVIDHVEKKPSEN